MSDEMGWEVVGVAGVQRVKGWPQRDVLPKVQPGNNGWTWTIGLDHGVYVAATEQEAKIASLEAAIKLAKQIESKASAELRRIKQAAQDVADTALVAAHGEVVWEMRDATFAQVHTASVAGHPCRVEVYEGGGVKWQLEPEYYGHPYTWEAPDLETAKLRAAAAALREPCKRWRVTLAEVPVGLWKTKGGTVEVWAVTHDGALYRAAQALGAVVIGGRKIEGEAVEVAG